MPRIRKKTSNRQNSRDRKKITKKVKEHNKKVKKASKKDVTWKSNRKKDTVIPNSFPFKDKVLAEQAEEKRSADEAKLAARRKPVEEEEDAPGIGSVNSTVLTATASLGKTKAAPIAAENEDVPDLIDTQLANLQDCLDRADVVLQVVDARDIAGCRNKWVEGVVSDAGGKFGLIVNKVDLVPREVLESWLPHLPENTFLFKSYLPTASIPASSSSKTQLPHNPEQCLGKEELLAAFASWAAEIKAKKEDKEEPVVVSLFGLPNVGKTSVLNSLLGRAKGKYAVAPVVPLASQAKELGTTTKMPVEVAVDAGEGVKVHVIDTPGWEPAPEDMDEEEEEDEDEDGELTEEQMAKFDRMEATLAGDLLRRNIGRIDKIKDVFPLANYVISRSNPQDLMLAYNVPYFTPGDIDGFLTSLARVGARMKKGGEADIDSAARLLMRDWSYNLFPYYCIPPKVTASLNATAPSTAQASVLGKIRSKKEMRTAGKGLVRFKGGDVDEREVILDDDYTEMHSPSDDEEDDEDFDEEDEDDEDEDDEEVGSDEDVPILIGADDGEELDLEDGPEPSSGSDVEEEEGEEEEEEEEEEELIEEPVPAPKSKLDKKRKLAEPELESEPTGKQAKRARSGTVSSVKGKANGNGNGNGNGSAKKVSFGKNVVLNAKELHQAKPSGKRKR